MILSRPKNLERLQVQQKKKPCKNSVTKGRQMKKCETLAMEINGRRHAKVIPEEEETQSGQDYDTMKQDKDGSWKCKSVKGSTRRYACFLSKHYSVEGKKSESFVGINIQILTIPGGTTGRLISPLPMFPRLYSTGQC